MILSTEKCVPCEGGMMPLGEGETRAMLRETPGWELHDGGLTIRKKYTFTDFKAALGDLRRSYSLPPAYPLHSQRAEPAAAKAGCASSPGNR